MIWIILTLSLSLYLFIARKVFLKTLPWHAEFFEILHITRSTVRQEAVLSLIWPIYLPMAVFMYDRMPKKSLSQEMDEDAYYRERYNLEPKSEVLKFSEKMRLVRDEKPRA